MTGAKDNTFVALDLHGEFRDILYFFSPDELIWMTPDDLQLNPFEIPVGADGKRVMPPDKWIGNLREWLRLNWLNEPSLNFFTEVITKLYRERGIFDGKDNFPSLSDVIEAIENENPPRGSDKAKAKEKVLDRLYALRYMLPGLDVSRSRDVHQLFGRCSVILDLVETKDVALPLLFNFLVMLFTVSFSQNPGKSHRLLVMEEPHLYLGGHIERRMSDLKESAGTGIMRSLRKANFCGVVVNQLISDLAPPVVGNLSSVICMRLAQRTCIARAASAMGLDRRQEQEIAKLPDKHAIVRFSRHSSPMYLAIKDISQSLGMARRLSREEAKERSQPILEAIPYTKRAEQKAEKVEDKKQTTPEPREGLHPQEQMVFAHICKTPWGLVQDRLEATGLNRDAESRIRGKLEGRGLIGLAGKVGAKFVLYEATTRGKVLANSLGLAAGEPGKGSIVHEAIIYYTRRSLERYSSEFRFKGAGVAATLRGVQPDLLLILPGGNRVPIQACYRNQADYEAEVFLKLHGLIQLEVEDADKVDFILAVAVSRKHEAVIERAIKRRNEGRMPSKLVLLDFDTVVDPGFDWDQVFEVVI